MHWEIRDGRSARGHDHASDGLVHMGLMGRAKHQGAMAVGGQTTTGAHESRL